MLIRIKSKAIKSRFFFAALFALIVAFILVFALIEASALTIDSFSANPSEISPGKNVGLSIYLKNNLQDDAENVNVALELTDLPFAPFELSSEQSVDKIEEDDSETFKFRLIAEHNAKSGIYKIPVKISYFIKGIEQEKTGFVSIIVNSEAKIKVVAEGYLVRGVEGEISIMIVNDGLSDVKLASINAARSGNYKINSPLYEYIGDIDSDDFSSVEYRIYTETGSSAINLPVSLVYTDAANKEYMKDEVLIIPVYSRSEAEARGLVEGSNYPIYISIIIFILLFFVFLRMRKKARKRIENE